MTSTPTAIGLIGCGNISDTYLAAAARSNLVKIVCCADARPEAAQAKAEKYGIRAVTVEQLLADPAVAIVLNLTVPTAHAPVAMQALAAGKHVYLEKPLASDFGDAQAMLAEAAKRGLRVGCAPDTFFGAAHQAVRAAIDAGKLGRIVGGSVAVQSRGMEAWHPNPDFFFQPGGGPVHDLGPYYVAMLVNLLGPVARVSSVATVGLPQRTITSQPLAGQVINVNVPTTVNGTLQFANGANIAFSTSWDVHAHKREHLELYGTDASLLGVNPNFFGGTPMLAGPDKQWQPLPTDAHPFGALNHVSGGIPVANHRIVGLVDMAQAIRQGRPHRASGELALHVLEVLDALLASSTEGRHITMTTTVERPEAVPLRADEGVFAG